MKILHTSDWHLGRSLYGRRRTDEQEAFLNWLADQLELHQIDALLIAGDIFDTVTPGNRSQELYYQFLCRAARSCCRHVVVTAGNHDSPSFLEAPSSLLRVLNVHVVGAPSGNPEDEVIVLLDQHGSAEAIVCAVPYLRDRDIRSVEAGESVDDKNTKLIKGIREHYEAVCTAAEKQRSQHGAVPVIAMGHLFAAGGRTVEGDGVRDLYVGSLAHFPASQFPAGIDYLALGHLHAAQTVGQNPGFCYSGSPLPMGFGEANQQKQVMVVALTGRETTVTALQVPCFQPLVRITGSVDQIISRIEELGAEQSNAWIEVEYTGSAVLPNLRELVEEAVTHTKLEVRRIKNRLVIERALNAMDAEENLDDLDVLDVFQRCIDQNAVPEEDRPGLIQAYREILAELSGADRQAED
jgi:exonuclease SbcD